MDNSVLAVLPPELRVLIYEHLFESSSTISSGRAVQFKDGAIFHPVTRTCRQMRSETLEMYLATTPFNAHLDDGPAVPLAKWLRSIGPDLCLLVRKIGIWDLHNLGACLYGVQSTELMLRNGTDDGEQYVLRPLGREMFYKNWFLKDIKLPLQAMGIGLERFCVVQKDGSLKQTSEFAMLPLREPANTDICTAMAEEFGLKEIEQARLAQELRQGAREIRIADGRRHIIFKFDENRRLIGMQQQFIPRDEEFYI